MLRENDSSLFPILVSGGGNGAVSGSDSACCIIGKDFEGESGDAGSFFARMTDDASFLVVFMLKRRPIDDRDGNNRFASLVFAVPAIDCRRAVRERRGKYKVMKPSIQKIHNRWAKSRKELTSFVGDTSSSRSALLIRLFCPTPSIAA